MTDSPLGHIIRAEILSASPQSTLLAEQPSA